MIVALIVLSVSPRRRGRCVVVQGRRKKRVDTVKGLKKYLEVRVTSAAAGVEWSSTQR